MARRNSLTSRVSAAISARRLRHVGIAREQMAVVLHGRAASRGVDDNGIEPAVATSLARREYFARAKARASSSRPMCRVSDPQQPAPAAITTSQPCRCSSRIVAALMSPSSACCAQPASSDHAPSRARLPRGIPAARGHQARRAHGIMSSIVRQSSRQQWPQRARQAPKRYRRAENSADAAVRARAARAPAARPAAGGNCRSICARARSIRWT